MKKPQIKKSESQAKIDLVVNRENYRNRYAGSPSPTPMSEVGSALSQIRSAKKELSDSIAKLTDNLRPILRASSVEPVDSSPSHDTAMGSSELVQELRNEALGIYELRDILEGLIARSTLTGSI